MAQLIGPSLIQDRLRQLPFVSPTRRAGCRHASVGVVGTRQRALCWSAMPRAVDDEYQGARLPRRVRSATLPTYGLLVVDDSTAACPGVLIYDRVARPRDIRASAPSPRRTDDPLVGRAGGLGERLEPEVPVQRAGPAGPPSSRSAPHRGVSATRRTERGGARRPDTAYVYAAHRAGPWPPPRGPPSSTPRRPAPRSTGCTVSSSAGARMWSLPATGDAPPQAGETDRGRDAVEALAHRGRRATRSRSSPSAWDPDLERRLGGSCTRIWASELPGPVDTRMPLASRAAHRVRHAGSTAGSIAVHAR